MSAADRQPSCSGSASGPYRDQSSGIERFSSTTCVKR